MATAAKVDLVGLVAGGGGEGGASLVAAGAAPRAAMALVRVRTCASVAVRSWRREVISSMREASWEMRAASEIDPSAVVVVEGVRAISSGPGGSGEGEEA